MALSLDRFRAAAQELSVTGPDQHLKDSFAERRETVYRLAIRINGFWKIPLWTFFGPGDF